MDDNARRPTVLAVFTGGTISCTLDRERGVPVPTLTGGEILDRTPGVDRVADVVVEDFGRYPGPHMHPERMLELARRIEAAMAARHLDGVVVTHGTDSLEETAFFLDRVLPPDLPVVVLGAMKLVSDPAWDGAANLLAACRVAASPASRGRGTMVVMADQIHAAAWVTKAHAESLEAFASPQTGSIGVVDRGQVVFFGPPSRAPLPRMSGDWIEPGVDLIRAVTGADGRHVEASLQAGARGLVVEGMGRGNLPPAMAAAVVEAARDIPVVMATRCTLGRALPLYGYEGGAAGLREAGVVFAGHLSGVKARLLLMMLLGAGDGIDEIRQKFEGDGYGTVGPDGGTNG